MGEVRRGREEGGGAGSGRRLKTHIHAASYY